MIIFTAQASTGKQGVLGPTKIYLAVQPNNPPDSTTENNATNPPPLAPVQQTATAALQSLQQQQKQKVSSPNIIKQSPIKPGQATAVQQVCNTPKKRKVVVEQVPRAVYT